MKCDDTGHCGNWPREIDDDSGNLCDATGQINSTLLQVYRSSERSLRTELKKRQHRHRQNSTYTCNYEKAY